MALSLEEEYRDILDNLPDEVEKKRFTVFDISGYPHYENVISNWYAYFLNADNPHGFGSLFYDSLRQLIGQDVDRLRNCVVEREYSTKKNGRIDLLVYEDNDDGSDKHFYKPIIIENKIYADLPNDLSDYRDSIDSGDDEKVGIVLCLHASDGINNHDFKVKTHQEYMNIVKENLKDYLLDASLRDLNHLQDFMLNIERMTRSMIMNEDSKYYFSHAKQIDKLLDIRMKANSTLIDNVYHSIQGKEGWKWDRSNAKTGYFDISVGDTGAFYYVDIHGLDFEIKLWMNDNLFETWKKLDSSCKEEVRKHLCKANPIEEFDNDRILARIKYKVDEAEIDSYHNNIINIISDDWLKIFEIINVTDNYKAIKK